MIESIISVIPLYGKGKRRLFTVRYADGKELASEDIVKAAAEAGISERTVQTVSYTHLDVYKRQDRVIVAGDGAQLFAPLFPAGEVAPPQRQYVTGHGAVSYTHLGYGAAL